MSARDSRGQSVPDALGNLGVDIPVYSLVEPESPDDDKIISTEGCYSCQLNGGSLSPAKHRRTRHLGDRSTANATDHRVTRRFRKSTHRKRADSASTTAPEHHRRRHDHSDWDLVKVALALDEAQPGRSIVDIRPAYKHLRNDTNYHVLHGVDKDHFRVVSSEDGVTLQLSEAIEEAGVYKVNIGSRSPTEQESQHHNRAFRLRVHVTVKK